MILHYPGPLVIATGGLLDTGMLSGKLLAGVAVTVGALAVSLRWALQPALIADYEIDITMKIPHDKVMEFFILHPDMQSSLYSPDPFSSPWNVVSTIQMTERSHSTP